MKHRIRWVIFILTWLQLGSVMNCVDVFSFSMVYMEKNSTIAAEAGLDDVSFLGFLNDFFLKVFSSWWHDRPRLSS